MLESFVVLGLLVALILVGMAQALLTLPTLLTIGVGCFALGGLFGVPAGLYYHLLLYRCLRARGAVPVRWWLSPTRYHADLVPAEWVRVRVWFLIGGSGFGLMVIGCVVTLLAALGAQGA